MTLLEVESIDVFYGPIQALRGVSLRVDEGEMVALVGANGAGKTTTLRTISGLFAPATGEIRLADERISGLPAQEVTKRGVAHLPEGRDLFFGMPVIENLKLGYWTRRKNKAAMQPKLDWVMDHFPILRQRANQAAGTLSGGEQQMLGVARAMMSSPKLLIVDELSLGLAPKIVAQLFDILEEINGEGTSVLLVEQFVHLALQHTARAYVLQKGEVVMEGVSKDLLADPTLVASYLGEAEEFTPEAEAITSQEEATAAGLAAAGVTADTRKTTPSRKRRPRTTSGSQRASRKRQPQAESSGE